MEELSADEVRSLGRGGGGHLERITWQLFGASVGDDFCASGVGLSGLGRQRRWHFSRMMKFCGGSHSSPSGWLYCKEPLLHFGPRCPQSV